MTRLSLFAATAALGLALPFTAMAQSTPATPPAQAQPTTPAHSATPATPATYTDAQLSAFAAASVEIDPISRSLQGATPEARAAAATQIRAALTRHNLDSATYNSIAAAAQADPALAARVAALRAPQTGQAATPAPSSLQSANPQPQTQN
jgi:Domain of unknown function (DUF4168)